MKDATSDDVKKNSNTVICTKSEVFSRIFFFLQGKFHWQMELCTTQVTVYSVEMVQTRWVILNDTLAVQDTLLYINIRGHNFLCKLRILTRAVVRLFFSESPRRHQFRLPSKELSGQPKHFLSISLSFLSFLPSLHLFLFQLCFFYSSLYDWLLSQEWVA